MSVWETKSLSELLSTSRKLTYGIVQPGKEFPGGIPIVRVNNFSGHSLNLDQKLTVSPEIEKAYERSRPKVGDLLISLVGSLGLVATADNRIDGWNLARAVGLLPFDDQQLGQWVKFFLQSPVASTYFNDVANTTVQHTLNLKDLSKLEVPLPSFETRNRIVELLSSIDDKIELNRQKNETLEAMARALFQDWFVDFGPTRRKIAGETDPVKILGHGIPDPTRASEIADLIPAQLGDDGLPEGWKSHCLNELARIQNGYAFKSKDWQEQGVPVIKIKNVKAGKVVLEGCGFVSSEVAEAHSKFELDEDDLAVGMTGYVGQVGRVPKLDKGPMLNQRVGRLNPTYVEGFSPFIYTCTNNVDFETHAVSKAHGSAQANINAKDLLAFQITFGSRELIKRFDEIAHPYFEKHRLNDQSNQTLVELRDLLLPKLMSGESIIAEGEAAIHG